jgi:hypothetical protein
MPTQDPDQGGSTTGCMYDPLNMEEQSGMLTLTTWSWVPPFAQDLIRDVRVRWALEELGLPYHT